MARYPQKSAVSALHLDLLNHGVAIDEPDFSLLYGLTRAQIEAVGRWAAQAWSDGFRSGVASPQREKVLFAAEVG